MTLAERDDELAALAELLSASHTGDGAVAVIDGPIGSGKTALLDDFAELSLAAGYRLLTVTAYVDERMLAFGVMRQLFTTANLPPDRAGHVARLLDNGMLGAPAAGSGSSEETSVYVRQGLSAELVRLDLRGRCAPRGPAVGGLPHTLRPPTAVNAGRAGARQRLAGPPGAPAPAC